MSNDETIRIIEDLQRHNDEYCKRVNEILDKHLALVTEVLEELKTKLHTY